MMKKLILLIAFLAVYHLDIFPQKVGDKFLVSINNIKLPIDNRGVLANVNIAPFGWDGGRFDSITVIYSAGFLLSGYNSDSLWANGVYTSGLIQDYWQGTTQSDTSDPRAQPYKLNVRDEDFRIAWQDWIDAVDLGADFYDGDGDGLYNPVDLNSNGVWDPNEDAPDMIGDQTIWCVYNDGVPLGQRRLESEPQGIEIYQTIFLDGSSRSPQGNIIYIRYRILNTGTEAAILDSVYFGAFADMDIGYHSDDLCGSDTLLQTGYSYSDSSDSEFGDNPPAVAITQLQGPYASIPGVTFIDVNVNGVYDEGIDTPLTRAYNHRGQFLGLDSLEGAINLGITSFMSYPCAVPFLCDPYTNEGARYRMLGMNDLGEPIDPCTWWAGEVRGGVNCADINPLFMFSGDPVTDIGWINTFDGDQRMTMSTGPFQLEEGKPVDIILAYSVGRGTDALNSVAVTKSICQYARSVYESNFDIETSVNVRADNSTPNNLRLSQNYPNPFNPTTTIKYQIPLTHNPPFNKAGKTGGFVTLKIYDVLGNEIATLVNEEKSVATYEVEFDAAGLTSGIYFYQIQAGSYIETKKMVLLR
jgi:hypothetical protein